MLAHVAVRILVFFICGHVFAKPAFRSFQLRLITSEFFLLELLNVRSCHELNAGKNLNKIIIAKYVGAGCDEIHALLEQSGKAVSLTTRKKK